MSFIAPLNSASIYNAPVSAFQTANRNIQLSVTRLASGNRLVTPSTDVAALSVSSRLKSQVVALKAAQSNTAQASSLTQVAEGGLSQIRSIVDRMKALAVQANSSSLTTADRALLETEFSGLSDEIDSIAENTRFNNIYLLNGDSSGENSVTTRTTQSDQATATLAFTANPTAGQTVVLNGVSFVAAASASTATEFTIGGTTAATVENLRVALNASTDTAISQATYERSGDSLVITQDSGGTAGEKYIVNKATSTTSFTVSGGQATQVANVYTLDSADDSGLGYNSVKASGSIGDSLVNTQSQVQGSVTLTLTANATNGETLRIDDGNGSYVDFTFATTASASTDIQIGVDIGETLRNAVSTLEQYSSTSDYGIRQLEFERSGDTLILRNRVPGNPTDLAGAALDVAETLSNGSLSASSFTNGTTTGVNVSAVNNGDFIGTIDGFTTTYVGADSLTASVTIGDSVYTADITDTTPAVATSYRFSSTSGGYFDVQLASGGYSVSDQTTADTYAARLNAAFSTLSFSQERVVSSFAGVNGLAGASATLQLDDFSGASLRDISVTAPSIAGGDGTIDLSVRLSDGTTETFRNSTNKGVFGAYETLDFVSTADSTRRISITNGASENSFTDATEADTFETALRSSFGFGDNATGRDFQVGIDHTDKINVSIADVRTTKLFGGQTPSVSSQGNAEDAQDILDDALAAIDTAIASVATYQERFDFASQNIESWRTGVDAARASLADTDIAEEGTNLAVETLKANMATAVIAQVTQLQSSLLGILRANN